MLSRIKGRVGSAHLIAVLALVLAVTGTSIALPGSGTVGQDDLKANSVTGGKIKNKSVGSGDVIENAFNGNQIKEDKLGTVPTAERATNVFWAVVSNPGGATNATLVRSSSPAPTVAEGNGVVVTFNREVASCAYAVSKNHAGSTVPTAGWAQASTASGNTSGVDVRTRNDAGTLVDGDFHLMVVCPA